MFAGGSALSKLARRGRGNILRLPQQQPQQQCCCRRMIHIEKRIQDLGLVLPPPSQPKANYNICCFVTKDNMLYVSGHLPTQIDGTLVTGKIGTAEEGGKPVEHGYDAARTAGLALLATVQEQLGGDLDRVEQVVKVCVCVCAVVFVFHAHVKTNPPVLDGWNKLSI